LRSGRDGSRRCAATEEKLAGKPLFQAVTARSSFAAEPKYDFSELKSSSAAVGPGEQQARRAKLIGERDRVRVREGERSRAQRASPSLQRSSSRRRRPTCAAYARRTRLSSSD
jgi:hypothetical protein